MSNRCLILRDTSIALVLAVLASPSTVQAQALEEQQAADGSGGNVALDDSADQKDSSEILVTAQRRVQVAREVPVALSALSPETIDILDIKDISSLGSTVPGVASASQGLFAPTVVIRGISTNSVGIGGEVSVGVFVDEVAVSRLQSQSIPFLDVERIEILRGPQGSLYGRNSTAGAISIVSNKPRFDRMSADVTGSFGSFDAYDATAAINVPLSGTVAARIAVLARGDGGYDRNISFDRNDQRKRIFGSRLSFAFEPSSRFTAGLNITYSNEKTSGLAFKNVDPDIAAASNADINPFSGKFTSNFDGDQGLRSIGTNLTLNYDISDAVTLKSVTSYSRSTYNEFSDIDGSALPLQEYRNDDGLAESYGQELRLGVEKGPVRLQAGANIYFERVRDSRSLTYDENVVLPLFIGAISADALGSGSPAFVPCDATSVTLLGVACESRARETIDQAGRYRSLAAFAEAEVKISDKITAIIGGRYSEDRKRFRFNTPLVLSQGSVLAGTNLLLGGSTSGEERVTDTWKDFQPRAILRWQPSPLMNIYGSITRGFKSGGFDPSARNGTYDLGLTKFDPETVWSYELGLKASLLDRLADINFAGYRYVYQGFQVQVLRDGVTSTLNVPNYNAWGAEADLTIRPGSDFSIIFGGAYNSAKYGDFFVDDRLVPGTQKNLRGNRGVISPEFSAFARADGKVPISQNLNLRLSGDVNWQTRQFFTIFGDVGESQPSYALAGARAAIESNDRSWSLALNVRNLFNKDYLTLAVDQGVGIVTFRGRPRTVSLDFEASF
jgi:iron complex outermembrane recepter protein